MKTKRKVFINICSLTIFFAILYSAYYLLLEENYFHASISSIIDTSQRSALKKHLIVLGLLPVYIAIVIFGAGILGIYLSSKIENLLNQLRLRKKKFDV